MRITPPPLAGEASIFPPQSAIWRISRELALVLGGPAAAILQIAHPEVALGVANHSDFRNDSLRRLNRTLDSVYTITFSPRSEVEAMAARVRKAHGPVQGKTPQTYSAFSLDAQMWVLATLMELATHCFVRFVGPLNQEDRESYYQDMRVFGTFFGLPVEYGPQNWCDFSAYYAAMIEGPVLGSLSISKELAHHVAFPHKPTILRAVWPISGLMTREFLPSPVRERLGFTAPSNLESQLTDTIVSGLLPILPPSLRYAPHYLAALKRMD